MFPKAMLIDMDDTIIAFEHGVDLSACWMSACRTHFHDQEAARIEEILEAIKERARWFWSDPDRHRIGRLDLDTARTTIITDALSSLNLNVPHLPMQIALDYGRMRDQAIRIFPDAIETLSYLQSKGIKLALITNGGSAAQRGKIERFNLAPYFDHIIIEEEFGIGKPDPRVYLHALDQLGVSKEEAWIIGDNLEWEVAAPQKLGIKGIWMNHRNVEPPLSVIPYRTITALRDLISIDDLHTDSY
ncbi:HAD family hydrolase [Paenibacillus mendelii]|uniref:HAD family hydrolase n=1 Tax=Paenibacillus mendelii TaxID=206163 RepID=A0ABV6J789_9BACL|nr:HAD family hydrolase [Paenibacillus mendelii]MCQ6562097.1 HAD family hydrolase [Paenibacillus mendelii]